MNDILTEHFLESSEQLFLVDCSIAIGIDGLDGLERLRLCHNSWDLKCLEEIIEEEGHFVDVEGSTAIGVVFVEDGLDVVAEHLLLKGLGLQHQILYCLLIVLERFERRGGYKNGSPEKEEKEDEER